MYMYIVYPAEFHEGMKAAHTDDRSHLELVLYCPQLDRSCLILPFGRVST